MTGALLYMFIVNQYNCHPRASAVSEGSLKGSSPRGFFAKAQNDSVSILIQIVGTPVILSSRANERSEGSHKEPRSEGIFRVRSI